MCSAVHGVAIPVTWLPLVWRLVVAARAKTVFRSGSGCRDEVGRACRTRHVNRQAVIDRQRLAQSTG